MVVMEDVTSNLLFYISAKLSKSENSPLSICLSGTLLRLLILEIAALIIGLLK